MNLKIKETGEVKKLYIEGSNGIEWTPDLFGNYGIFENDLIPQNDFNWWKKFIENYVIAENSMKELADKLGVNESYLWGEVAPDLNTDLDNQPLIIISFVSTYRTRG
jgi:hypothetical protein